MKWPSAVILFLLAVPAFGQGGQKLSDPLAVSLLNDASLRVQVDDIERVPFFTRVYAVGPYGECDRGKCPHTRIYIALSAYGEAPEQVVWILDGGIDFKVLKVEGFSIDNRDVARICFSSQGDDRKVHQFLVEANLHKMKVKNQICSNRGS